jgi:two-component system, LytTR family, sensor histidine kinase AlgZ
MKPPHQFDQPQAPAAFDPLSTLSMKVPQLRAVFVVPVDWCSGPVMLRVIVLFNLLGLSVAIVTAPDWPAAFQTFVLIAAFLEPATLLWLMLACATKRPLAKLPVAVQYTALGAFAVLATQALWWLASSLLPTETVGVSSMQLTLVTTGTALAITHYLRLRQLAAVPRAQQAHLADLEQRMRPHFLFNSLNAVSALIAIDATKAETAIDDLAELYRTLTRRPSGLCSLKDEIEIARRYLGIEALRFGERMVVTWQIAPELLGSQVLSLCVQPLVENAVKHGVEASATPITISVAAVSEHGRLKITVSNTLAAHTGTSLKGSGTALANLRERLRLVYDIAADSRVEYTDTQFIVTLWLPI